mmetsp:Transcript_7135/g.15467  ORF Transcript_7135/g.15467 Transcript_7135/m.15467 type:complete len:159 (+) Transcript_7135:352-828(+)
MTTATYDRESAASARQDESMVSNPIGFSAELDSTPCRGEESSSLSDKTIFLDSELQLPEQAVSSSSTELCSTPLTLLLRSPYISIPRRTERLKNSELITPSGSAAEWVVVVVIASKKLSASVKAMEVHALRPRASPYWLTSEWTARIATSSPLVAKLF